MAQCERCHSWKRVSPDQARLRDFTCRILGKPCHICDFEQDTEFPAFDKTDRVKNYKDMQRRVTVFVERIGAEGLGEKGLHAEKEKVKKAADLENLKLQMRDFPSRVERSFLIEWKDQEESWQGRINDCTELMEFLEETHYFEEQVNWNKLAVLRRFSSMCEFVSNMPTYMLRPVDSKKIEDLKQAITHTDKDGGKRKGRKGKSKRTEGDGHDQEERDGGEGDSAVGAIVGLLCKLAQMGSKFFGGQVFQHLEWELEQIQKRNCRTADAARKAWSDAVELVRKLKKEFVSAFEARSILQHDSAAPANNFASVAQDRRPEPEAASAGTSNATTCSSSSPLSTGDSPSAASSATSSSSTFSGSTTSAPPLVSFRSVSPGSVMEGGGSVGESGDTRGEEQAAGGARAREGGQSAEMRERERERVVNEEKKKREKAEEERREAERVQKEEKEKREKAKAEEEIREAERVQKEETERRQKAKAEEERRGEAEGIGKEEEERRERREHAGCREEDGGSSSDASSQRGGAVALGVAAASGPGPLGMGSEFESPLRREVPGPSELLRQMAASRRRWEEEQEQMAARWEEEQKEGRAVQERLEAQAEGLKAEVNGLKTENGGLKTRVGELELKLRETQAELEAARQELGGLEGKTERKRKEKTRNFEDYSEKVGVIAAEEANAEQHTRPALANEREKWGERESEGRLQGQLGTRRVSKQLQAAGGEKNAGHASASGSGSRSVSVSAAAAAAPAGFPSRKRKQPDHPAPHPSEPEQPERALEPADGGRLGQGRCPAEGSRRGDGGGGTEHVRVKTDEVDQVSDQVAAQLRPYQLLLPALARCFAGRDTSDSLDPAAFSAQDKCWPGELQVLRFEEDEAGQRLKKTKEDGEKEINCNDRRALVVKDGAFKDLASQLRQAFLKMERNRESGRAEQRLGGEVQVFRISEEDARAELRGQWGVRAARRLEAGEAIGLYAGLCLEETSLWQGLWRQRFMMSVELTRRQKQPAPLSIDPWQHGNQLMFINDFRADALRRNRHTPALPSPQAEGVPNVAFVNVTWRGWPFVAVVARTEVGARQELLIDYGEEYWKSLRSQGGFRDGLAQLVSRWQSLAGPARGSQQVVDLVSHPTPNNGPSQAKAGTNMDPEDIVVID